MPEIKEEYEDWDSKLLELTQVATGGSRVWNLYMLPLGHRWQHVGGITAIGDAAHLATPFAGQGVNTALQDALLLSKAIIKSVDAKDQSQALDRAVAAFEQDMFQRAKATQEMTLEMMTMMFFTEGAPRNSIERYIITAVGSEMGPLMTAVLTPVIYAWFLVFKLIW